MLRFKKFLLVIGAVALAPGLNADEFKFESAGVRGGFGAGGDDSVFCQYEVFAKADLPWRWDWGDGWGLQTGFDVSAGILQQASEAGFVGKLGPAVTIGRPSLPLAFELGWNPTLISRERFDQKDLGNRLQFTSYAGLRADVTANWSAGYRIQHTSNGGFGGPNPGLNMHMFSLSYRF